MSDCCEERIDGEAPGGGGTSGAVADGLVLAELFFDQMTAGPIVDGAFTVPSSVGPIPFVAVNSVNAAVWEWTAGGLHFVQPAGVAGTLVSTGQTAAYIYCELGDVPFWRLGSQFILQFHASQYVPGPTTVNDGPRSGLLRLANDPIANAPGPAMVSYGFRRSNTAGVDMVVFNQQNAGAGTGLPDADVQGLFDVAQMTVAQNGFCTTGVANRVGNLWTPGNQIQVAGAASGIGLSEATRMFFGSTWAASGAPTLEWTIPRAQLIRA